MAGPTCLDDWPSPSCGEMNHQQDDANDEENPRDLRRNGRDTRGAEHAGNQADDKKNERVIQHNNTSCSWDKAEGVPFHLGPAHRVFTGKNAFPQGLAPSMCRGTLQSGRGTDLVVIGTWEKEDP